MYKYFASVSNQKLGDIDLQATQNYRTLVGARKFYNERMVQASQNGFLRKHVLDLSNKYLDTNTRIMIILNTC